MNFLDLWVDCQTLRLVQESGAYLQEYPPLVRGDHKVLRIRFVDVSRSSSAPVVVARSFPAGTEFILAAKAKFDGDLLVLSEHASHWNQSGQWDGESGVSLTHGRCACLVELNSSELLDAISTSPELEVWFEIQCVIDGATTTLWRLKMPVLADVYRGNEGDPPPATPTYPTTEQFDYRHDPSIRLVKEDGGMRVYIDGVPGVLVR